VEGCGVTAPHRLRNQKRDTAAERAKKECFICRHPSDHDPWCPVIARDRTVTPTLDRRGFVVRKKERRPFIISRRLT
jgi:hypothetical protein